jgi:2,3-dihydroxybenzoate decarboxylase
MNLHRRQFLCSAAAFGGSTLLGLSTSAAAERRPGPRIAIEEHFLTPELLAVWQGMLDSDQPLDPGFQSLYRPLLRGGSSNRLVQQLLEVGSERIQAMDRAGITLQVLSLTSPGVQVLKAQDAGAAAARSNDFLTELIRRAPTGRFAGFGCCAPQDPARAAREIERCAGKLGFAGMLINSHTQDQYLDAARFAPIFEALQAHDMPLYLHPQTPAASMIGPYSDYGLIGPSWGFAAETGLHAARLIYSGLFDRYPKVRVILGHLGEGLPWWLARMDSRFAITASVSKQPSSRLPSEVFKAHFNVTTSGMTEALHLRFALELLGADRVLFATDYPYEAMEPAVDLLDRAAISEADRSRILHGNASRLLRLPALAATQARRGAD